MRRISTRAESCCAVCSKRQLIGNPSPFKLPLVPCLSNDCEQRASKS